MQRHPTMFSSGKDKLPISELISHLVWPFSVTEEMIIATE